MWAILLLPLISLLHARVYSKAEIDPDWALFNMPAFTGSWYGRDFPDCKSPGIYLWYWGLSKIVGANIQRIRFLHHLLLGSFGVIVALLTHSFWNGLIFTVMINSGWLYAFHGNVSQLPAAFIVLALTIPNPWIASFSMGMAVFQEPKLIFTAAVLAILHQWYVPVAVYGVLLFIVMYLIHKTDYFKWVWESAVTIPKRMATERRKIMLYFWSPWYTAQAFLYILPWIFAAIYVNASWQFWLPAAVLAVTVGKGYAIRQNHMLPLVAWIALAGIAPWWVLALCAWDFLSGGLYLGDIWNRFYVGLRDDNILARKFGEWLRNQPGDIWVNWYHSAVYIHARKPVKYAMTEQYEINQVATERRAIMKELFHLHPPEWVVIGSPSWVQFNGSGYKPVKQVMGTTVYHKEKI